MSMHQLKLQMKDYTMKIRRNSGPCNLHQVRTSISYPLWHNMTMENRLKLSILISLETSSLILFFILSFSFSFQFSLYLPGEWPFHDILISMTFPWNHDSWYETKTRKSFTKKKTTWRTQFFYIFLAFPVMQ